MDGLMDGRLLLSPRSNDSAVGDGFETITVGLARIDSVLPRPAPLQQYKMILGQLADNTRLLTFPSLPDYALMSKATTV